MTISIGTWIQDCDPRYSGRKVMIHSIITIETSDPPLRDAGEQFVVYFNGKHNFSIGMANIKPADYTGRKGWKITTPPHEA